MNCLKIKNWKLKIALFVLFSTFFIIPTNNVSAATVSRPPSNLGLVGYWPMDEGVGSKVGDASGSGNTGTISGATWTNGKHGKALNFNGATSKVNFSVDRGPLSTSGSFTLNVWIKTVSSGTQFLIQQRDINHINGEYVLQLISGKVVYWDWDSGYGFYNFTSNSSVNDGKWHLITFVRDGTLGSIYIDSVLDATLVGTIKNISSVPDFALGHDFRDGISFFNGSMDDVRIYNRALSATEISKMHSSGQTTQKQVSNSGLVGYWSMNEGRGNKVIDSSGKGNIGTITGATWADGKRGGALSFDTVNNNYVNIPYNSSIDFGSGDLTVSGWAKTSFTQNAAGLIYKGDNVFNLYGIGWEIRSRNSGSTRFEFCLNAGVGSCNRISNSNVGNLIPNTWYFFAFTYVRSTGEVVAYINDFTPTIGTNTTSEYSDSYPLQLGNGENGVVNGSIDDVRIYNRALSATEIQNLYKQGEVTVNTSQNSKLTNGLVGLWSFNGQDISGNTAYDRSGLGNNSTITGATVAQGKVGQALNFNGSSQYAVSGGVFSDLGTSNRPYSLSGWIKLATNETDGNIIHMSSGSNGIGWCLPPVALVAGKLRGYSWNGGGVAVTGTTSLKSGVWYHFVNTWDATNGLRIFVNGVLENSTAMPVYSASGASNYLWLSYDPGGCAGTNGDFDGSIDEARVYNRALSGDEVKQLYNMGK